MAAKVATTSCFQWSQPIVNHCSSSSSKRRSHRLRPRAQVSRNVLGSSMFNDIPTSAFGCGARPDMCNPDLQHWSRTTESKFKVACRASLDAFSDEEFSRQIQELALRSFQHSHYDNNDAYSGSDPNHHHHHHHHQRLFLNPELDWPSSIERRANSVELPLSLRMIKRKKMQNCKEVSSLSSLREVGESAVKKAFSSMVFIVRELQSFTLQMIRESLCFTDLKEVLDRVRTELHASFVWLFEQVFSHTPTLMVYVMILLANFTVHSMSCNAAIIVAAPPQPPAPSLSYSENTSTILVRDMEFFDSASMSIGENDGDGDGGGNRVRMAASGTSEGGDRFREGEVGLWKSIVEEAWNLRGASSWLDRETVRRRLVSPVSVEMESDDGYVEYVRTEVEYKRGISEEPNNPLLLANYAQFLYLVAHDYDRAEEYFKRAIKVEPADAEALGKYATFLWKGRKQTMAAEETYLEAIAADPTNTYFAANYAHFLWNTGGDDTCYPLKQDV